MPLPDLPAPPTQVEIRKASRRTWLIIGALFAFFAIIVLWTCGRGAYRNYRIARSAVDQFHQRLDRADYDSIYENATDAFRSAGSRGDEIKFFENVHQKMGNSGAISPAGFHVNWQSGHFLVDQVFITQFTQGQAQEAFVWIIDDGKPRLQTYRIDGPKLH
jgi:hypothetical protein